MALIMENNNNSYNYDDNMNNILLSALDSHKSVPAPFLTKTYHIVDDSSTDHIVSWGEDHSTFIVWRPPEFARDLLPNYFKHNNFSSFVRQLNTYGFRKIVPDRWEFANEYFKKGEKHLLCEIHRRKTSSHSQVSINHQHNHINYSNQFEIGHHQNHFPYPSWSNISSPDSDHENTNINHNNITSHEWGCVDTDFTHPIIPGGSVALSEDNERLRRSNTMLVSELAHMRKLYNDIIYFVQNHVKPVTPSNVYHHSSTRNNQYSMRCGRRVVNFDELSNNTSQSSVTVVEEVENDEDGDDRKMRLFGVPLRTWRASGKKRLHSELGLNLMPPSPC